MRNFRRFELHKGNKEKFWEIRRYDKTLYFKEGNIKRKAGEKEPTVKPDEKKDFRQAQLAYDKEIQRKLKLGYVEVDRPSAPSEDVEFQAIRLVSLDAKHTLDLNEAQTTKILNFMIDKLVFNKHTPVLNISKWWRRTLHRSDYESFSDIDTLSEDYCTYFDKWMNLSKRDRDYNEEENIPLFKYTDPQYWIITEGECQQIIQSIQSEITKRREKLDADEKKSSPYFRLKEAWLNFHINAQQSGGYQVIPCSLQFHSTKHGHSFFMDTRSWNDVYNTLLSLDIWDRAQPEYLQQEFGSVESFLVNQLLEEWDIDEEPINPDSSTQDNVVQQLLNIEDEVNEAYRLMLRSKNPKKEYAGATVLSNGFRWNASSVKTLSKTLESMDDDIFTERLEDFYAEEVLLRVDEPHLDGNLDLETQRVVNEILNDACHLLNHAHQNIHNTDEELLPSAEDEHGDAFEFDTLEAMLTVLHHLYPDILDHEVISDEQILQDYTHRPAGLDEELMESWRHLLPDSFDCVDLLQGYRAFRQAQAEIESYYDTAKDFCLQYLEEASQAMKFQSELASLRRKMLKSESNTMGQVLLYKLNDLSEPWILTPSELAIIIEAAYQAEQKDALILDLMKFFNTAADADGCTLLSTSNH